MKTARAFLAAGLAYATLAPALADARDYHHRDRHHRVCHTEYRHHHRVRVCR